MTSHPVVLRPVICPKCRRQIDVNEREEGVVDVACPSCRTKFSLFVFPRLSQPLQAKDSGERAFDGDAVCFFHADRKAALACEQCGRFICELCKIPLGTRAVCPSCLTGGLKDEKLPEIVSKRTDWSRVALCMGLYPLLGFFTWPLWCISAPAAIIVAIYGWNKEGGLVYGRRRWIAVVAILVALCEIAAFTAVVIGIQSNIRTRTHHVQK